MADDVCRKCGEWITEEEEDESTGWCRKCSVEHKFGRQAYRCQTCSNWYPIEPHLKGDPTKVYTRTKCSSCRGRHLKKGKGSNAKASIRCTN